ncbi:pectin lyase A like protein [Verticillium longisporum]|nr:pectin lyase A like protein [Verticillium longisporum]
MHLNYLLGAMLIATAATAKTVVGKAYGFATGVTGGGSAKAVTPTSASELAKLLADDVPRTIVINKTWDFTGSKATGSGCDPVERGPAPAPASANGTGTAANGTHRYHQNVLAALERADNPLRAALGTGDVRVFLGRAKELRNRWKYAEGDESSTAQQQQQSSLKGPTRGITGRAPLESYDLDSMFGHIFGGFDQGYGIAEAWVAELASRADMVPAVAADGTPGADMAVDDDEEFDFMVDAMDWEAV